MKNKMLICIPFFDQLQIIFTIDENIFIVTYVNTFIVYSSLEFSNFLFFDFIEA